MNGYNRKAVSNVYTSLDMTFSLTDQDIWPEIPDTYWPGDPGLAGRFNKGGMVGTQKQHEKLVALV